MCHLRTCTVHRSNRTGHTSNRTGPDLVHTLSSFLTIIIDRALHYHEITVIYPYHFLVVITQFFSRIIFIHDSICIITGSPGLYLFMILYVIKEIGGNKNSIDSLNVMINYHYHSENRLITR